jgi:hypothetical protein
MFTMPSILQKYVVNEVTTCLFCNVRVRSWQKLQNLLSVGRVVHECNPTLTSLLKVYDAFTIKSRYTERTLKVRRAIHE